MPVVYLANDKYSATLRSAYIASPADTTLQVTTIPTNLPTIVTVGWNTIYETVFSVTGTSGTNSSNYALTGVAKIKGASTNLPENSAVNCLNHEEYFNQYGDLIGAAQTDAADALALTAVKKVELPVGSAAANLATGDGQVFFRVPVQFNAMNLTAVAAVVYTAGTTGTLDVQIRNKTQAADMLSTKIKIDSGETDTLTAATPAVIDAANDDVATGDVIAIDIDAVHTTPAKGLVVEMTFALP